ncbi:MAG: LptA/OstA family protein [Acidobacteriota bacterium]
MASPTSSYFSRLRRLVLLLGLVLLAALVWLFAAGRSSDELPVASPTEEATAGPSGDTTLLGEGFEFTQSEKDRKVFHIAGESVRVRDGQKVLLDGVHLTFFDEDQVAYHVFADEANFDYGTRDARLTGNVRLSGPEGMTLTCDGLLLKNRGRLAESISPVVFTLGGVYQGRGDRLRVLFPQDLLTLSGNVRLTGQQEVAPIILTAQNLYLERPRQQIRATGNVILKQGPNLLRGGRVNAFLSEDESRLTFLRARWDVSGHWLPASTPAVASGELPTDLRFTGRSVSVVMNEAGTEPASIELEGTPVERATLISRSTAGTIQTLDASYLVARFQGPAGRYVEAFGRPHLVETLVGDDNTPLRQIDGDRLRATFDVEGELRELTAGPDVVLKDPTTEATGDRLVYSEEGAAAELFGEPAVALSERGRLEAPRLTYNRTNGLLHADGGVVCEFENSEELGFGDTPLGGGEEEGPVRVESAEAFFRDEPRAAMFRGKARAWRGSSLLLADELRVDAEPQGGGDVLTGRGSVKTLWVDSASGQAPVEVTSRQVEYRQAAGELRYRGQVRTQQGGRTLACRALDLALTESGEAESMTCVDNVRLVDPASDHRAEGSRAYYDLVAKTIDLRGDPAKLIKGDGAEVEGRRVVYDIEGGRGRVMATDESQPTAPVVPTDAVADGTGGEGER